MITNKTNYDFDINCFFQSEHLHNNIHSILDVRQLLSLKFVSQSIYYGYGIGNIDTKYNMTSCVFNNDIFDRPEIISISETYDNFVVFGMYYEKNNKTLRFVLTLSKKENYCTFQKQNALYKGTYKTNNGLECLRKVILKKQNDFFRQKKEKQLRGQHYDPDNMYGQLTPLTTQNTQMVVKS